MPAEPGNALCAACMLRQAMLSQTIAEGRPHAEPAPPPAAGKMAASFPQFEDFELLGRGGMGVVYKARQKSLNRIVAIKVLAPERGGEARFAERFAREAELLAKMSHPHIVTVHDFGETDGLYYLVMEFVDGVNLRDLLRDGRMAPEQALAVVSPVCEALEYAHARGVIHRDIKPENLLLDREGRLKIADFGIASLVGAAGEQAGTPPYMAPEQSGGAADARADVYALGVVLYEMLTGHRPEKEIVAPSLETAVDVRLDEIVLRALEKEPARRFQTAEEFRTVVQNASGPPAAVRSGKNPKPRVPWPLIVGVGFVLISAIVVWSVSASRSSRENPRIPPSDKANGGQAQPVSSARFPGKVEVVGVGPSHVEWEGSALDEDIVQQLTDLRVDLAEARVSLSSQNPKLIALEKEARKAAGKIAGLLDAPERLEEYRELSRQVVGTGIRETKARLDELSKSYTESHPNIVQEQARLEALNRMAEADSGDVRMRFDADGVANWLGLDWTPETFLQAIGPEPRTIVIVSATELPMDTLVKWTRPLEGRGHRIVTQIRTPSDGAVAP